MLKHSMILFSRVHLQLICLTNPMLLITFAEIYDDNGKIYRKHNYNKCAG